jgi:hypothetical protein
MLELQHGSCNRNIYIVYFSSFNYMNETGASEEDARKQ